ncbi:MAG: TIGR03905 family TSCPD domain-containing protein [Oscillibacter sp.]|nr:TIGR03905 family TSCPD domain-containing protein [Oscillibacter sp.]
MTYTYSPTGVCSSRIDLELEDGVIRSVAFTGGCNGNLQGISSLVKGMPAREAIERLQGIQCGWKPTSCPDQLSKALTAALEAAGQ